MKTNHVSSDTLLEEFSKRKTQAPLLFIFLSSSSQGGPSELRKEMGKRQRDDLPPWWSEVVGELRSQGGYLHPSVCFSANSRELSVYSLIQSDTLLMKLPRRCLLTPERAMELSPWLAVLTETVKAKELYTPTSDLIIAMAMASQRPETLPYLKTLPDPDSFDSLPRRWAESKIDELLRGSPLLNRARAAKEGVCKDYDAIKEAWNKTQEQKCAFPSFQEFSNMLAAVSSRAFGFGDSDEGVVMIPILDLCDHSRGRNHQKNLAYKRLQDGSVEVRSIVEIKQHELLRLTYGARGNSQLLLNYGFSIARNWEPDGSSNDVLEFSLNGEDMVNLRAGPKSYSYGPLVKALEQACTVEPYGSSCETPGMDDMEAFLDECEESEEIDIIYGNTPDCGTENESGDTEEIQRELEGFKVLRDGFRQRIEAYGFKGKKLQEEISSAKASHSYFAAILAQSELRTLHFYVRAIEKIEAFMQNQAPQDPNSVDLNIDDDDLDLLETQTEELAEAFMKIRHADLMQEPNNQPR